MAEMAGACRRRTRGPTIALAILMAAIALNMSYGAPQQAPTAYSPFYSELGTGWLGFRARPELWMLARLRETHKTCHIHI